MSSFTAASWVRAPFTEHGRPVYRIAAPGFDYDIGYLGSGLSVHVPAGFLTDLASVPLWAIWLLRLSGLAWALDRIALSAAVHDLLRADLRFTKLTGDAIFLTAMETEGAPFLVRQAAYWLVSLNTNRTAPLTPVSPSATRSADLRSSAALAAVDSSTRTR